MKCVSGKNSYDSEEIASEALIQNRIRNDYRAGSGPIDIYRCDECEAWHFTSKGEPAHFLLDTKVIERIRREKQILDWSDEL